VKKHGGRVVVIAARAPKLLATLRQELNQLHIKCDEAHCLPEISEAVNNCPRRGQLTYYQSYLWHKARIAHELGVTHYFDDEAVVHDLFRQLLPCIKLYYPWERPSTIGQNPIVHDDSCCRHFTEAKVVMGSPAKEPIVHSTDFSGTFSGAPGIIDIERHM
jgi:hypothetical protein